MTQSIGRRAVLGVYAAIIIIPLVVVAFGSLKTTADLFDSPFALPSDPSLQAYREIAGGSSGVGRAFANSAIVTVSSVLLTLALGSMAAYGVSRLRGFVGIAVFGFLILGMSLPAQTNMIPQYSLFDYLGLLDSLLGLILINVVTGLPVAVFIMAGFMRTLPDSLFEAADIDGASAWRVFQSVVLPVSAPSIATVGIFLFVIQWNELLYPLLFTQSPEVRTLPLALLSFQGEYNTNYPVLFTGVLVAAAPVVVLYVFLQRYFVAGMTAGADKG